VPGWTSTLATGTAVTVTPAVPLLPSLVAVIVAAPMETPVTTPLDDTVATSSLLDVQVTGRSVTVIPRMSFTVATRGVVCPTATELVAGDKLTLPTGEGATVNAAVPLLPSLVAVMVLVPGDTAVTAPTADTVATSGLLELQVTTRPVRTLPFGSRTTAVAVSDWPTVRIVALGWTSTVPTGTADTATLAVPLWVSLLAVIVTVPTDRPVTTPASDTVATSSLLDAHVTTRSVTTTPLVSFTVAARGTVPPTTIELLAGSTATLPTGARVTVTTTASLFPSLAAVIVA
jgi:hypothetical protein